MGEKDQEKARSIDRQAARAKKRLKVAEKNTEESAKRRSLANKKFAKAKYHHAYNGVMYHNVPDDAPQNPPPPPNPKLAYPGEQLDVRVAAQEKNVADLEFKKAMEEEKAARAKAVLLAREAQLAKKEDGQAAVSAERQVRDAVKTAAIDQEKANEVYKREEGKMAKADAKASKSVATVMTSKTGLSRARQAAKDAQTAAVLAAKKAARSVAEARRVSLKLRMAIERSSDAIDKMDQHVAKSMEIVLPAEEEKASEAWDHAKRANDQLRRFRDMVKQGREHLVEKGDDMRKDDIKRRKTFDDAVDAADGKLENALSTISDSEQQILPASGVAPA